MSFIHTAKSIASMPTILVGGTPMERAGIERLAWNQAFDDVPAHMDVEADPFEDNHPVPVRYTGEGDNLSPGMRWIDVPRGVKSFAIICEDPDAPTPEPFVHWLAYNIPADSRSLSEGVTTDNSVHFPLPLLQGRNSTLKTGYTGPMPPKGDVEHRYFFQVFALDTVLPLEGGEGRGAVVGAMRGHVLAKGGTVGTFKR